MGHNRNLADYAHHFDGTNIDLGSGNIETEGVLTYEDVTNVDAIGIITARAGVKVPDSQKVFLGTGDDLQIYHDGVNSQIREVGTGDLRLRSSKIQLMNPNSEPYFIGTSDGAAELYYDNSKKLETTTTGATVTGTLVSDGVTSELDLSAISSSITDTAVDVFVYDTRKDSDGGAWRKRTQHTSWYNETLNTSTRGSRKEFPAVAVIVATTASVFIYDGDDPDLPLWMRFNQSTNSLGAMVGYTSFTIGCVTMLNGLLMVGLDATNQGNVDGLRLINFISEHFSWKANSASRNSSQHWPIEDRNGGRALGYNDENYIVNEVINDVAATVLPNSKIDDATGLPIPTIAVGTNGGASIIKDNGTVVDITITTGTNYDVEHIDFTDDNRVVILWNAGGGEITIDEIPSADTSANYPINLPGSYYNDHSPASYSPCFLTEGPSLSNRIPAAIQNFRAVGTTAALSVFEENKESEEDGMVAFISSSYNTGYQQGRIKGAFLSDTDTTNVSADTLNSANTFDGTFATSTGWTADSDWTISGGVATCNGNNSGRFIYPTNDRWTGSSVVVEVTVTAYTSGTLSVSYGTGAATSGTNMTATGTYKFVNVTTGNDLIYLRSDSFVGSIDNVKIYYAEYDRSLNNKGLIPYGTITKSAVATGADLVAYSGFSASNYLQQPYNSDLDFGTGDFSIMFWYKTTAGDYTAQCFLHRGDGGTGTWGSGKIIQIEFNSTNLAAFLSESAFSSYDTVAISGATAASGQWQHYTLIRRGTFVGVYLDGELKDSTSSSRDLSNTSAKTWIGERPNMSRPLDTTSLALFRMSASAPSDEQIKKIYEDEKVLFQENAKATLYGSSDAVTALGYDEDTELLHVGTSAGRSDFQGLRRINNTTTAVTTAISASDELIAEQ